MREGGEGGGREGGKGGGPEGGRVGGPDLEGGRGCVNADILAAVHDIELTYCVYIFNFHCR